MNRELDRRGRLLHMGGNVNIFLHISLFVCACMFDFNLFYFVCYFFVCGKNNKEKKKQIYIYEYLYTVDVCGC